MRKQLKTGLAVWLVIGIVFSGITFADQTGNTHASAFGFWGHTGTEPGGPDFSGFGPPPMAGDQVGSTDGPAFGFPCQTANEACGMDRQAFGPPPSFFDTNNDGLVSQDEFPGPDEHFGALDQNGDGYIDQEEALKGPPEGPCPIAGD